jgi:hypothetical protein
MQASLYPFLVQDQLWMHIQMRDAAVAHAADVRNAVVVVSRWFGGILLGPARFGLINNTARQLLEQTGFIQQASTGSSKQGGKKHRKKHT